MSRTITAMFDSRGDAESARARLGASNIEADRVRIIDQSSRTDAADRTDANDEGFWASLKDMFMPDDDRNAYGEGIRRGGFMLVAEVEDSDADEACRVLDDGGSVDFAERQTAWRNDGWAPGGQAGAFGQLGGATPDRDDREVDEQRIPIAQEELRVGKREVDRGSTRVHSYVREVPVREQVSLREENVTIERRAVGGQDAGLRGDDIFQDRDIEMTTRGEEAVISKEAHVTEEVVVRKTSEDHVETVDDTVRRTEVEIDEDGSAFKGFDRERDGDAEAKRAELERSSTGRRDEGLL